mgnify:CR=1 FL=1
MDCDKCVKNLAVFAGGVLFGSAGLKLLSSRDAKKAYTHAIAAALRMKESVMETVTTVQENAPEESPPGNPDTPQWRIGSAHGRRRG